MTANDESDDEDTQQPIDSCVSQYRDHGLKTDICSGTITVRIPVIKNKCIERSKALEENPPPTLESDIGKCTI